MLKWELGETSRWYENVVRLICQHDDQIGNLANLGSLRRKYTNQYISDFLLNMLLIYYDSQMTELHHIIPI